MKNEPGCVRVVVHLGCYDEIPQTGGLFINNRPLFLTVLQTWKSTIQVGADLVSGENLLPSS